MYFREYFTVVIKTGRSSDALSVHSTGKWKGREEKKGKTGNNTKEELDFNLPVHFTCQIFFLRT
ncbi:RIKEN cDNA A930017M01, isoform CRA_b [Mus musculus]|nr:RIKEN cDNA A930017M01, isoform CRA_b [Mus musculus]